MQLREIARVLGCTCPTDHCELEITRIADPSDADTSSITFLSNDAYAAAVQECAAPVVIVKKGVSLKGKVCLEVADPYCGYARTAQLFESKEPLFGPGVHPTASVDPSATVEETASVGPYVVIARNCVVGAHTELGAHCVLEPGTRIGDQCRIHSRVTLCRDTQVGNRVIIESGAVVGSEGFGNALEKGEWIRIPSFGRVEIQDDAWIGANTTIDRGALGSTKIKRGARLDNLIHIAHNVVVGENDAMAAQVGVSGSTEFGARVIVGGQAGFVGHIKIGDDSFVGAKAGISKSIDPGSKVTGYPARDFMKMRRIEAAEAELPGMVKELRRLRKELDSIRNRFDSPDSDQ